MVHSVEFSKIIPCDSDYLYNWHNMPKALERLVPYWEKVNIKTHPEFLFDDENNILYTGDEMGWI